jgi:hypothetical protein
VNISAAGILFSASTAIPVGALVQMELEWPAVSAKGMPLMLRLFASVIRSDGELMAARILHHGLSTLAEILPL